MPTIRFRRGGAYLSDLTQLCGIIRTNGSRVTRSGILVTHQDQAAVEVTIIMNLAYSSVQPPDGSLYTLGFANAHGSYRFAINPWPQTLPAMPGATALNGVDGSYGSLGYSLPPLPTISMQNLKDAVMALANYGAAGGPQIEGIKKHLARLIIAVSEAARISSVAQGVADAIAGTPYTAQLPTLRSWNGRTLSN